MIRTLMACTFLSLVWAAPAWADDGLIGAKVDSIFAELDGNQDGLLTVDESQDHWLAHKFERIDGNEDGLVSRAELAEFMQQWWNLDV